MRAIFSISEVNLKYDSLTIQIEERAKKCKKQL